jgi:hypothetical protein
MASAVSRGGDSAGGGGAGTVTGVVSTTAGAVGFAGSTGAGAEQAKTGRQALMSHARRCADDPDDAAEGPSRR